MIEQRCEVSYPEYIRMMAYQDAERRRQSASRPPRADIEAAARASIQCANAEATLGWDWAGRGPRNA